MTPRAPQGWNLTAVASVAVVLTVVVIFLRQGITDEAYATAIRATARFSFSCFWLAFIAAPAAAVLTSGPTRWLLSNRRYLGVAFAIAHLLHAAAIFSRAYASNGASLAGRTALDLGIGGMIYLVIVLMLATSFDRTAALVGRRAWRVIHITGAWLVFISFAGAYGPRAVQEPPYVLPAVMLLIALGLRIARCWQRNLPNRHPRG